MTWIKWIIAYLFDCVHRRTTWPQRGRAGLDYVCCLECGREFPYSTRWMRIVDAEEQMEDRSPYGWADFGSISPAAIARSNASVAVDTIAR